MGGSCPDYDCLYLLQHISLDDDELVILISFGSLPSETGTIVAVLDVPESPTGESFISVGPSTTDGEWHSDLVVRVMDTYTEDGFYFEVIEGWRVDVDSKSFSTTDVSGLEILAGMNCGEPEEDEGDYADYSAAALGYEVEGLTVAGGFLAEFGDVIVVRRDGANEGGFVLVRDGQVIDVAIEYWASEFTIAEEDGQVIGRTSIQDGPGWAYRVTGDGFEFLRSY